MDLNGLPSAEESRLARAILEYLSRHPEAKDTQEGISTWWIQGQQLEQAVHVLSKVLEFLVARDFVIESRGPDSRPYYKINPRQRETIDRFRQEPEP